MPDFDIDFSYEKRDKIIEYVQERPDEFPFSTVEGIPFIDEDVISFMK